MREPQCGRELRSSIWGCPGPLGISSVSQWCRTCGPRVGDPMHNLTGAFSQATSGTRAVDCRGCLFVYVAG